MRRHRHRNAIAHLSANAVRTVVDARAQSAASVVERAAEVIFSGGTIIFPTDTVYGIGCDPFVAEAIDAIYQAKHRPGAKPLTIHVATVTEFLEYVRDNPIAVTAARRLLPGPLTIIVRRPKWMSAGLTSGLPSIGFRVPDDALCTAILERCGPLAATSANFSASQAYRGGGGVNGLPPADLLIENGPTKYRTESTVVDLCGPVPHLVREGVVPFDRLTEMLATVERPSVPVRNAGGA